jgi:hypothetical protein
MNLKIIFLVLCINNVANSFFTPSKLSLISNKPYFLSSFSDNYNGIGNGISNDIGNGNYNGIGNGIGISISNDIGNGISNDIGNGNYNGIGNGIGISISNDNGNGISNDNGNGNGNGNIRIFNGGNKGDGDDENDIALFIGLILLNMYMIKTTVLNNNLFDLFYYTNR